MKSKHLEASRLVNSCEQSFSVGRVFKWPRALYQRGPQWLHWTLYPFFFCLQLLRQIRLEFWIVEGEERCSKKPLSILCAANDMNRSYLAGVAFGESYSERSVGRTWIWNANRMAAKSSLGHSLMIVQAKMSQRRWLGGGHWFFIPDWVSGVVDLPIKPEIRKSQTIKSDLRKIKKNGVGFEVTHEADRFDDFYHHMYTPYISGRHGLSALVMPYESVRKRYQDCDLLLITKQDESIGGVLILYTKAGPRLWCLGIRDGDPKNLRYGTMAAIYHFSFQYLEEKGFRKVASGLSRAFLRDGVLWFKRKWTQRIVGLSSNMFALKAVKYTGEAMTFLNSNPFIFEDQGSPSGAVFVDAGMLDSPNFYEMVDKEYFHPGLSKLLIYIPQLNRLAEPALVPPSLVGRIVVRSTEEIANGQ